MPLKPGTTAETAAGLAEMHGNFLAFLRRRLGDAATAEDILQVAYLKAVEHGAELREDESSVAWFYRILRNAIADHYRRQAAHSRAMEKWAGEWKEDYEPEIRTEACACIHEAVSSLKPEYRAAIERVDLGGESIAGFATAQRTTVNNASVRLHRARKAVAKRLTEVCGTCATHLCIDCTSKREARQGAGLHLVKR